MKIILQIQHQVDFRSEFIDFWIVSYPLIILFIIAIIVNIYLKYKDKSILKYGGIGYSKEESFEDFIKDFETLKIMEEEIYSEILLTNSANKGNLDERFDLGQQYRMRLIEIVQKHRSRLSHEKVESLIGLKTMVERYGEEKGTKIYYEEVKKREITK